MRLILAAVVAIGSPAIAGESIQAPLKPDSLLNWLRITDVEGFRLLHASDQNGYYFAVRTDSDGDLLLANYCHNEKSRVASIKFRVTDARTGRDLLDWTSEKHGPDPSVVTYGLQKANTNSSRVELVSVSYATGSLYPLRGKCGGQVRVEFYVENRGVTKHLLDTVLQLPGRPNPPIGTEPQPPSVSPGATSTNQRHHIEWGSRSS